METPTSSPSRLRAFREPQSPTPRTTSGCQRVWSGNSPITTIGRQLVAAAIRLAVPPPAETAQPHIRVHVAILVVGIPAAAAVCVAGIISPSLAPRAKATQPLQPPWSRTATVSPSSAGPTDIKLNSVLPSTTSKWA